MREDGSPTASDALSRVRSRSEKAYSNAPEAVRSRSVFRDASTPTTSRRPIEQWKLTPRFLAGDRARAMARVSCPVRKSRRATPASNVGTSNRRCGRGVAARGLGLGATRLPDGRRSLPVVGIRPVLPFEMLLKQIRFKRRELRVQLQGHQREVSAAFQCNRGFNGQRGGISPGERAMPVDQNSRDIDRAQIGKSLHDHISRLPFVSTTTDLFVRHLASYRHSTWKIV